MTIEECAERWLIQIERIICLLENEFFILNEEQLNYRLHVRGCSIREIMNHLFLKNARLLVMIDHGILTDEINEEKQDYEPGLTARYLLSHLRFTRCLNPGRKVYLPSKRSIPANVMYRLLEQQTKLKEFISLRSRMDMNKRVVPFRLMGIIKLSLAETLEYTVLCQKNHFAVARHLLKLQQ
jgi:hypothetical protein